MKGYVYSLEAVIAASLLLGAILFIYPYQPPSFSSDISEIGYSCLTDMNNRGMLSKLAVQNNEQELKAGLRTCIPESIGFESRICSTDECSADVPSGEIYSISYFDSGYDKIEPRMIRLWMWVK